MGFLAMSRLWNNSPPQPRDAYGIIKLAQCKLGLGYGRVNSLPLIHARQFNVTGIGQSRRFVIPSICYQAAQISKSLSPASAPAAQTHYITAGNTAVRRDFLAIQDVCSAYAHLLSYGQNGQIYNVCSGTTSSIDQAIEIAGEVIGTRLSVERDESLFREGEKTKSVVCGDASKLRALGWEQKFHMQDIITDLISHYKNLPDETE